MIHSFLIIGQSNMAGRGNLDEAVSVDTSRIKILRNGRWQGMFRPLNFDRAFSGTCLAESFAEKYSQKHNVDVGIIPCADGGTCLEQWKPGSLLFDHAVYQARLAQRTSTIAGVLWHQGESDCGDNEYPLYRQRLQTILDAFRKELDLYDVPFMLGGLGDFLAENEKWSGLNYIHINDALKQLSESNERTGFVSAEGLGSNADLLHFNARALYEFGIRYFEEFEKLRDEKKVFTEKPSEDEALRTEMELL